MKKELIYPLKLIQNSLRFKGMRTFNSIKEYLRTLDPEERDEVRWSIDALMVQYWEILTAESDEGKDYGGVTIPIGDHFLCISLHLEWFNMKLNASVQEVKLLDSYEYASMANKNLWPHRSY